MVYFWKSRSCPTIPFLGIFLDLNPFFPVFSQFLLFLQEPYLGSKNLMSVFFWSILGLRTLPRSFPRSISGVRTLPRSFVGSFFWMSKYRPYDSVIGLYRLPIHETVTSLHIVTVRCHITNSSMMSQQTCDVTSNSWHDNTTFKRDMTVASCTRLQVKTYPCSYWFLMFHDSLKFSFNSSSLVFCFWNISSLNNQAPLKLWHQSLKLPVQF